jgi:hypothetical protein
MVASLFQRLYFEGGVSFNSECPICQQFIPMDFDPCLQQPELAGRNLSVEDFGCLDVDSCAKLGIPCMNVRIIVFVIIREILSMSRANPRGKSKRNQFIGPPGNRSGTPSVGEGGMSFSI